MKQFALAIPRGQDPDRIKRLASFWKVREESVKIEQAWVRFCQTGNFEDFEKLKKGIRAK